MKGGAESPSGVGFIEVVWSWLGALSGIFVSGYLSLKYLEPRELTLITGPMGASAVLVFGTVKNPFAQPRNLVGGHFISALAGVACFQLLGESTLLAAGLAVSFAIAAMHVTKTVHPPGGATALIAVIGDDRIHNLGFLYPFMPVGLGAIILLLIALLFNNLSGNRKYPEYWF